MTFEQWWDTQRGDAGLSGDREEIARDAWDTAVSTERNRCQRYADGLRNGTFEDARDVTRGIASGLDFEDEEL